MRLISNYYSSMKSMSPSESISGGIKGKDKAKGRMVRDKERVHEKVKERVGLHDKIKWKWRSKQKKKKTVSHESSPRKVRKWNQDRNEARVKREVTQGPCLTRENKIRVIMMFLRKEMEEWN